MRNTLKQGCSMRQYPPTVSAVHYHVTGNGTTIGAVKCIGRIRIPRGAGIRMKTMASMAGGLLSMCTIRTRSQDSVRRNGGRHGSIPTAVSSSRHKDMFAKATEQGVCPGQRTTPPWRTRRIHGPQQGLGAPVLHGRIGKSLGRRTQPTLRQLRNEAASTLRMLCKE